MTSLKLDLDLKLNNKLQILMDTLVNQHAVILLEVHLTLTVPLNFNP